MQILELTKKYLQSSWINKLHIPYVVILSAYYRFCQKALPFSWFKPSLGQDLSNTQLCCLATPRQIQYANRIGRFVQNVCKKTPWKSECFVQSRILSGYLKRKRIPHIIHLGLTKNSDQSLLAHAWIFLGNSTPLDEHVSEKMVITATFCNF